MESNEQNKLTNRNRLIDPENRLTALRGEEVGGLGAKGEVIKKKKTLIDTDKCVVISRGKKM